MSFYLLQSLTGMQKFVDLILNYSFHGDHLKACTLGSLNHSSFFVVKKKRKIKQQCVCDSPLLLYIIVVCLFLLLDVVFCYESITVHPLYHWQIWMVSTLGIIYSSISVFIIKVLLSRYSGVKVLGYRECICSTWASSVTQQWRICLQCRRHRTHRVWPLGGKDLLGKGMATHSSILAWEIP